MPCPRPIWGSGVLSGVNKSLADIEGLEVKRTFKNRPFGNATSSGKEPPPTIGLQDDVTAGHPILDLLHRSANDIERTGKTLERERGPERWMRPNPNLGKSGHAGPCRRRKCHRIVIEGRQFAWLLSASQKPLAEVYTYRGSRP